MEQIAEDWGQTLGPSLMFSTLPMTTGTPCLGILNFPENSYYDKSSIHLSKEFPLVADMRSALSRYSNQRTHPGVDPVHFNLLGAAIGGHAVRDKVQTLNTCIKSTGAVQFYCLKAGAFTTSGCALLDNSSCPCTSVTDCPADNVCLLRVCTTGSDCPASTDTCNIQP